MLHILLYKHHRHTVAMILLRGLYQSLLIHAEHITTASIHSGFDRARRFPPALQMAATLSPCLSYYTYKTAKIELRPLTLYCFSNLSRLFFSVAVTSSFSDNSKSWGSIITSLMYSNPLSWFYRKIQINTRMKLCCTLWSNVQVRPCCLQRLVSNNTLKRKSLV